MLRNKVEEKVKKKETSFLRKLKRCCILGVGLLLNGTDQKTVRSTAEDFTLQNNCSLSLNRQIVTKLKKASRQLW